MKGGISGSATIIQGDGTDQELLESEGLSDTHAFVPLSEMFGYSTDLRSKTSGRAAYSMQFHSYEPMSPELAEKALKG